MITITIKNNGVLGTIDIVCPSKSIHEMMNVLEAAPVVDTYKITVPSIGVVSPTMISEYYPGYGFPAGKLVSQFNWNK